MAFSLLHNGKFHNDTPVTPVCVINLCCLVEVCCFNDSLSLSILLLDSFCSVFIPSYICFLSTFSLTLVFHFLRSLSLSLFGFLLFQPQMQGRPLAIVRYLLLILVIKVEITLALFTVMCMSTCLLWAAHLFTIYGSSLKPIIFWILNEHAKVCSAVTLNTLSTYSLSRSVVLSASLLWLLLHPSFLFRSCALYSVYV